MTRRCPEALVLAVCCLLRPALAVASGQGWDWAIHGFYIIDFLVFAGILVWIGRRRLKALLEQRYKEVAREMEEAQKLKAEAEARYMEYARRIAEMDKETRRIFDEVRAGTRAEVDQILAEARRQVEKITAEEETRLAQESKRLRDEMVKEAADLSVDLARRLLAERLDGAAQERLMERALADLEESPAATPEVKA